MKKFISIDGNKIIPTDIVWKIVKNGLCIDIFYGDGEYASKRYNTWDEHSQVFNSIAQELDCLVFPPVAQPPAEAVDLKPTK